MLSDLHRLGRQATNDDPEEAYITGLEEREPPLHPEILELFENTERWIALPEQALQSGPAAPLYAKNVPREQGLQNAISSGVLLLDFNPQKGKPAEEETSA